MLSWLIVKKNKYLVIFLIVFSIITSLSALLPIEPCRGDYFGCPDKIIASFIAGPSYPALVLTDKFLHSISYNYYTFYDAPSLFKFIPILIIPTYAFLVSFLFVWLILKFKSFKQNLILEERNILIKHAKQRFFAYYILFILVASGFIFQKSPPAPFASNESIINYCRYNSECINNFLHYNLANCKKETRLFVYPLKVSLPTNDSCMFDSFIEKKLYKDNFLQDSRVNVIYYPGDDYIHNRIINKVISFFQKYWENSSNEKKVLFCSGFNQKVVKSISDEQYCLMVTRAYPVSNLIDSNQCFGALNTSVITREHLLSEYQKSCAKLLLSFHIYNPDFSVFMKNHKDVSYGYYFNITSDPKKIDQNKFATTINFSYVDEFFKSKLLSKYYLIEQSSTTSPAYIKLTSDLKNQNTKIRIDKISFLGTDIYFKHNVTCYAMSGCYDDKLVQFIKDGTFITISGRGTDGVKDSELLEISEFIIKNK